MARKSRSRQFKRSSRVIDMDEARKERQEKREQIRAEELHEKTTSDERRLRRKRALRRKQSRHRLIIIGVTFALVVMLAFSVVNIIKLKGEEREALKKQEQLKAKQEQMQEEIKDVGNEENVEDLAREKLKLTKPGETIYIAESEEQ